MLIAAFLAVALHMGFMSFEFDPQPVFAPIVTLPRSVSVFLRQRNTVETPVDQAEKTQTVEHVLEAKPAAAIEPEKPVTQKVSPSVIKTDMPLKQPVLLEKAAKQPAVEKIMPASQGSENSEKNVMPEADETAKAREFATPAEPQAAQENDGVSLPGALQMAYPRYQLNDPPKYPGLARKRGQEGTVILQVLINREGRVDDLKIENTSGFVLLDRAAKSSVRKWSFEPGRRGEERIPMWVRVPVTFKLKK
jgi:protein TonB